MKAVMTAPIAVAPPTPSRTYAGVRLGGRAGFGVSMGGGVDDADATGARVGTGAALELAMGGGVVSPASTRFFRLAMRVSCVVRIGRLGVGGEVFGQRFDRVLRLAHALVDVGDVEQELWSLGEGVGSLKLAERVLVVALLQIGCPDSKCRRAFSSSLCAARGAT